MRLQPASPDRDVIAGHDAVRAYTFQSLQVCKVTDLPCRSLNYPVADHVWVHSVLTPHKMMLLLCWAQDSSVALSYGPQKDGACTSAHAHALHALAWEGLKVTAPPLARACSSRNKSSEQHTVSCVPVRQYHCTSLSTVMQLDILGSQWTVDLGTEEAQDADPRASQSSLCCSHCDYHRVTVPAISLVRLAHVRV